MQSIINFLCLAEVQFILTVSFFLLCYVLLARLAKIFVMESMGYNRWD